MGIRGRQSRTVTGIIAGVCLAACVAGPAWAQGDAWYNDVSDFEVTAFDPRYHDDPNLWLGDLGLFGLGINGVLAQPFNIGTVGLARKEDPNEMSSGVRVSGTAGEWKVNMLGVQSTDATGTSASDAFIARFSRSLAEDLQLGVILTAGDPDQDLDAHTVGVDLKYRTLGNIEGQAWLQKTHTELFNENEAGRDDNAWGLHLNYPGKQHRASAWYQHFGDDFDPALGSVSRPGVDDASFQYAFRHTMPDGSDWQLGHNFNARDIQALSTDEASRALNLTLLDARDASGDNWTLFVSQNDEVLVNGYDLVNHLPIAAGQYNYARYGMGFDTSRFDNWMLGVRVIQGDYLGGQRDDVQFRGDWQAAEWLRLNAEYAVEAHKQPVGQFTARKFTLRSTVALAPGWSFSPLVQVNNISDQVGMNANLRWNTGFGRDLFLTWNRTLLRNFEDRLVAPPNDSVLKGMYRVRF
ncbi:hypothetical protein F3N42_05900 [Marinihelvus fidelis]|uniref:TonB-dependent receptor n=1 Tax=Marinihelvus fidelis TaxID=2613842 RepID=A0A5N0TCL5_9GAMM|nr:hypothetical protein [Marinihelvus fidelis]KAA9132745.1 hypothetical protein F3N42_05900 [Marinihelvus fidelis]